MPGYTTRPLDAESWPDFAELVEAHNGVWGGCWCMGFHPKGPGWGKSGAQPGREGRAGPERRSARRTRVRR